MNDQATEPSEEELPDPLYTPDMLGGLVGFQHLIDFLVAPEATNTLNLRNIVVLVDRNPEHHATNLSRGIQEDGSRREGCPGCYRRLLTRFFHESQEELAAWWWDPARTETQRRDRLEEVQDDHVNATNAIRTMPDMNTFINNGRRFHTALYALDNLIDTGPGVMAENCDQMVEYLREISHLFGPINIVASIHHGFTHKIRLGGELTRGQIPDFVNRIQDFLADDLRWIFYACSTAGDDQHPYPALDPDPDARPFAAAFQHHLAGQKPQAEVWGHLGPGDTLERPYLVRFRGEAGQQTAVSLFDHCLSGAERLDEAYRLFKPILMDAFRTIGYGQGDWPSPEHAIQYLPFWPLDFEQTSLQAKCLEAWRARTGGG